MLVPGSFVELFLKKLTKLLKCYNRVYNVCLSKWSAKQK